MRLTGASLRYGVGYREAAEMGAGSNKRTHRSNRGELKRDSIASSIFDLIDVFRYIVTVYLFKDVKAGVRKINRENFKRKDRRSITCIQS